MSSPDETEAGGLQPLLSLEVCIDTCNPARLASFWSNLLAYTVDGDADGRWIHLEPPSGRGPALNLQLVPEPKAGKNRLHLDLYVNDPDAWIERCEELGARRVRLNDDPDDWYQVMADPEGNEFCVCRETAA